MNAITQVRSEAAIIPQTRPVDLKLEVVVIPVSDVDRAKALLQQAGLAARRRLRRR